VKYRMRPMNRTIPPIRVACLSRSRLAATLGPENRAESCVDAESPDVGDLRLTVGSRSL
jgi:hypothetical protein